MTAHARDFLHTPVMLDEVVAALAPANGGVYVDATFGGGGYARAILAAANCQVIGIDRDPAAIASARKWAAAYGGRLLLAQAPFSALEEVCEAVGVAPGRLDGAVFDLGVSSMQLDHGERGFSFLQDGPLDMRMSGEGVSAADVVARADEETLANILYDYGEERQSRKIARAIIRARREGPIESTGALAALVEQATGPRGAAKIHPATRTFQALRIYVNDELGELARALAAVERMLAAPCGRLAVVTFHSLEDRIVKQFFAQASGRAPSVSRHLPAAEEEPATFKPLFAKPQVPSAQEVAVNPRARSAKLRVGIRSGARAPESRQVWTSRLPPIERMLKEKRR